MKAFTNLALIAVVAYVAGACKAAAPSGGSEAKDSEASADAEISGAEASGNAIPSPMAITFMDPTKQLPIITNLEFLYKISQLTFEYKTQRGGEQIMQLMVKRDSTKCTDQSCLFVNAAENTSVTFEPSGKIIAFTWHGAAVDLSTIAVKAGVVDLRAVSCDMALGSGCFP